MLPALAGLCEPRAGWFDVGAFGSGSVGGAWRRAGSRLRLGRLAAGLADPDLYTDHEAAAEISEQLHQTKQALQPLYTRWEELAEEMAARELV